jgi:transcriptional regulator with XRE-family HTH domain
MPGRGVPLPALREERVRNALTQEELAEQSGVTRSTIARLEIGQKASMVTARRLARALRVEPADLMGMERPAMVAEARARYETGGRRRTRPGVAGTGDEGKAPGAQAA